MTIKNDFKLYLKVAIMLALMVIIGNLQPFG